MALSPDQKARIVELEKLISRPYRLKTEEFVELLKEARDNYTLRLVIKSINGETNGLGAITNALERTVYTLDSVGPSGMGDDDVDLGWIGLSKANGAPSVH